jgi:predicted metalloprotease with PDZ domain
MKTRFSLFLLLLAAVTFSVVASEKPVFQYVVSMPEPSSHRFQTEFKVFGLEGDTVELRMPKWTPGYYQLMNYAADVLNLTACDSKGQAVASFKTDENTWSVVAHKQPFMVKYEVMAAQQFVARSFLDSTHAYIVPANNFLYVVGQLNAPVSIEIKPNRIWKNAATGLEQTSANVYVAPNYDILYDCPLLVGNLTELPVFDVNGIKHRFLGYEMGRFDGALMMRQLKKFVQVATEMLGEVPYTSYTFLGIGQGRGGIEHLNNTTVSFNGDRLTSEAAINDMILYLGHEYFHNFNVKRIRPFELGPFDYNRENRTTQLWVSEGLTMYYQYVLAKRAGLMDDKAYLKCFEGHINSVQKNPARLVQSMSQSSYATWEDGPFTKPGLTISYYEKGPVVGLIMDLAIRCATQSRKSLDDVMRFMYENYYKKLQRGFTDAEFEQACETVAGVPLTQEFEYITTTKEFNYAQYLQYLGLELVNDAPSDAKTVHFSLRRSANMNATQADALKKWMSE